MCRLYAFHANAPTKVECSLAYSQNALLVQSQSDERGMSHADGWGLGWYRDQGAEVERSVRAAFHGPRFTDAAARVRANTVVAHVRRATVGRSSPENTHPFQFGPWLFAHNGTVRGFHRVHRRLEAETDPDLAALRGGETDSEAVFYWLLSRWRKAGHDLARPARDVRDLAQVVSTATLKLMGMCEHEEPEHQSQLNFVLTDGRCVVATRVHHSLHWVMRIQVHDCEICGVPHIDHEGQDREYRAVVVASEPLSDEPWAELPDPGVLWVDPAVRVDLTRL